MSRWLSYVLLPLALFGLRISSFLAVAEAADDSISQQLLQVCLGPQQDKGLLQKILSQDGSENVNLNIKDPRSGQTPLMASVLRGRDDFVRILLDHGADASIPEKDGYTPPHGAAFQGRKEVLKILIEKGVFNHEFHKDGYLPFHRACWGKTPRHSDFVDYMLSEGLVKHDVPAKDGRTCRDMTKNPETIKVLEKYEARKEQEF